MELYRKFRSMGLPANRALVATRIISRKYHGCTFAKTIGHYGLFMNVVYLTIRGWTDYMVRQYLGGK